MALAKKKKDQGNASFKAGENGAASQAYKEGADLLKDMQGATPEQLQESGPLRLALLSNLAAAYLKLNENGKAAEACQQVTQQRKTTAFTGLYICHKCHGPATHVLAILTTPFYVLKMISY